MIIFYYSNKNIIVLKHTVYSLDIILKLLITFIMFSEQFAFEFSLLILFVILYLQVDYKLIISLTEFSSLTIFKEFNYNSTFCRF